MSYQVYIEGVKAAGSHQAVAAAIGQRYGLPAEALAARMAQGRFRVKQGVDLQTAKTFATDLISLGATATVVDAAGQVVFPSAAAQPAQEEELVLMPEAPAMSAQIPAQDNPLASAGPSAQPAPSDSPFAGIQATSSVVPSDTGLAVAGSGAQQDLGVLEGGAELSIAALDAPEGAEPKKQKSAASFAPPADNAFLPPGAEEEAVILIDAAAMPEKPKKIAPAQELPPAGEALGIGGANASLGEGQVGKASLFARLFDALNGDARLRFAAGLIVATLLAFIPAHLYATMSENTAYSQMRSNLRETQSLVEDPDEWDALTEIRAGVAEQMDKKRVNVAITASLIWLAIGGGLGFLFFRKLPWEHLGPRIAKAPEPKAPTS